MNNNCYQPCNNCNNNSNMNDYCGGFYYTNTNAQCCQCVPTHVESNCGFVQLVGGNSISVTPSKDSNGCPTIVISANLYQTDVVPTVTSVNEGQLVFDRNNNRLYTKINGVLLYSQFTPVSTPSV